MRRKALLIFAVVVGLAFAGYVLAQTYNAPMISGVSTPSEVGTGAEGPPVIGANASADSTNESEEAEIEKIDSDGDRMSDWFEENYTHTDPSIVNDRYILILRTSWGGLDRELIGFYSQKNKIPRENILMDYSVTFSEFEKHIKWLAEKSDGNDFVYIHLSGHGRTETIKVSPYKTKQQSFIRFADEQGDEHKGERVNFQEIGEILNDVKCNKMLISIGSCVQGNVTSEIVCNNASYPRICIVPTSTPVRLACYPQTTTDLDLDRLSRQFFPIEDEYLTAKKFVEYYKKSKWPGGPDIEICDKWNISDSFYFGEAKIKDYFIPYEIIPLEQTMDDYRAQKFSRLYFEKNLSELCAEYKNLEVPVTCQQAADIVLAKYPGNVFLIKKTQMSLPLPPDKGGGSELIDLWVINIALEKPIKMRSGELAEEGLEVMVDTTTGEIKIVRPRYLYW